MVAQPSSGIEELYFAVRPSDSFHDNSESRINSLIIRTGHRVLQRKVRELWDITDL